MYLHLKDLSSGSLKTQNIKIHRVGNMYIIIYERFLTGSYKLADGFKNCELCLQYFTLQSTSSANTQKSEEKIIKIVCNIQIKTKV